MCPCSSWDLLELNEFSSSGRGACFERVTTPRSSDRRLEDDADDTGKMLAFALLWIGGRLDATARPPKTVSHIYSGVLSPTKSKLGIGSAPRTWYGTVEPDQAPGRRRRQNQGRVTDTKNGHGTRPPFVRCPAPPTLPSCRTLLKFDRALSLDL